MKLKDLVGEHILSGIEVGQTTRMIWGDEERCEFVLFTLDGINYMALEDPNDGYRSYLEDLEIVDQQPKYKLPDVNVVCSWRDKRKSWLGFEETDDILIFVDAVNNKEILTIGTENTDDYYPYCVIRYTPENLHINDK